MEDTHGRLRVHNVDQFVELAQAAEPPPEKPAHMMSMGRSITPGTRGGSPGKSFRNNPAIMDNAIMRKQIMENEMREKMVALKREMDRRARDRKEKKEMGFQARLEKVVQDNDVLMHHTNAYIARHDDRASRQRDKLHGEWSRNVFFPLQDAITEEVDRQDVACIERRRREQFQDYLREGNCKMGVFRDIIQESEYDPLGFSKANTQQVSSAQCASPKQPVTVATPTKVQRKPPREVLDLKLWDKVESTPHGRYSDKKQKPPPPRVKPGIHLDHFLPSLPRQEHRTMLIKESGHLGKRTKFNQTA
eukprot:TRINITY_DN2257_c0_g2_i1.p1 TRINITY_DN2257_c0_g2~~TRINITY_DN2257_c0_g2_i1.p1  ORF type:complete len:305 (+),score=92.86 TRINITY_DN2257_c0_g2_i1:58-972(+)